MEYILLLLSSFVSATILPMASELTLATYINQGLSPVLLVGIATLGNTVGAWVNWCLGRYLCLFQHKRWFYFSQKSMDRAQVWFNKYGLWALLFAWVPIIGDPLTLIAGVLRVRWLPFLLLVGLGKGLRYTFIAWLMN